MPFLFLKYKKEEKEFISYNNIENYNSLVKEEDLKYLVYYLDFKLILYFIYNLIINKEYLKRYIFKYFSLDIKYKERDTKASIFFSLLNSLELESLSNSLDLIINFKEFKTKFLILKELNIISLYKYLTYSSLYKSKQNIKRYNTLDYKTFNLNPYYIVIKS